jgi:FkbM family methyltransferase
VIRRFGRAMVRAVKRELCIRRVGEFRFAVSHFGPYEFWCANRTEYSRTVELGGEAMALGAFLFSLRPDDIVWDIGASVGLLSVHAAGVAKTVISFEPDPATFRRLGQNVRLNGLSDRVDCRMEALGDRSGEVALRTDGLDGNAPSVVDLGRHAGSTTARMETIDRLIDAGVPAPTVLKIDVEGAELLVLRGAGQLLSSPIAPRMIFLEVHPAFLPTFGASAESVDEELLQRGYDMTARQVRDDQVHVMATHGSCCAAGFQPRRDER